MSMVRLAGLGFGVGTVENGRIVSVSVPAAWLRAAGYVPANPEWADAVQGVRDALATHHPGVKSDGYYGELLANAAATLAANGSMAANLFAARALGADDFVPATESDMRAAGWVPVGEVSEKLHKAHEIGVKGRYALEIGDSAAHGRYVVAMVDLVAPYAKAARHGAAWEGG